MTDEPTPPPAAEPILSEKAQRAYSLGVEIVAKAPILGDLQDGIMIAMVKKILDEVSRQLRGAERKLAKAGAKFNEPGPAMPYLLLGALATAVEGFPDDDDRFRLMQAGRAIGEFWTELVAAKIEQHLEEQAATINQGDAKS